MTLNTNNNTDIVKVVNNPQIVIETGIHFKTVNSDLNENENTLIFNVLHPS